MLAELDAGTRPEFDVDVTLRSDGVDDPADPTAVMTVRWTLRPNR